MSISVGRFDNVDVWMCRTSWCHKGPWHFLSFALQMWLPPYWHIWTMTWLNCLHSVWANLSDGILNPGEILVQFLSLSLCSNLKSEIMNLHKFDGVRVAEFMGNFWQPFSVQTRLFLPWHAAWVPVLLRSLPASHSVSTRAPACHNAFMVRHGDEMPQCKWLPGKPA